MSRKLLELLLIFGLPFSIHCDPGGEFVAEVMQHLCRWLKVSLDCGPTNHGRGRGAIERLGGVAPRDPFPPVCGVASAVGRLRPCGNLDPPRLA